MLKWCIHSVPVLPSMRSCHLDKTACWLAFRGSFQHLFDIGFQGFWDSACARLHSSSSRCDGGSAGGRLPRRLGQDPFRVHGLGRKAVLVAVLVDDHVRGLACTGSAHKVRCCLSCPATHAAIGDTLVRMSGVVTNHSTSQLITRLRYHTSYHPAQALTRCACSTALKTASCGTGRCGACGTGQCGACNSTQEGQRGQASPGVG